MSKTKAKPEVKASPAAADLKTVGLVIDKINKDFGDGTVMYMKDRPKSKVPSLPTGSLGLDIALGVWGIPKGRIVEIYGPESAGKTTVALHIIAEAQRLKGAVAFIDAEHAFDADYAEKLGVDTKNMLLCQPDYGEQGLEVADRLIDTGKINVVVIDSVAALTPQGEIEGEMGDAKMGVQARMMGQALRKLTSKTSKKGTIVIFINQIREKLGIMFGNPETTTGGNALKFYASIRLDVRKTGVIKDGDEAIGNRIKIKVVKNKVSPPFKTAEMDLIYGEGIDGYGEVLDIGVALDIIKQSGSWFSYNNDRMGQGRDAVKKLLRDNEELTLELRKLIKTKIIESQN